jgi:hypothetical protein
MEGIMTLGEWRQSTLGALGPGSAAVEYLDEKIAAAPEHEQQEVPGTEEDVRGLLLQIHADGEDRKKRKGTWTRAQETARVRFAGRVQEILGNELRNGALEPWQIAQVFRGAALVADTPMARDRRAT